jgi:hypothetical protein
MVDLGAAQSRHHVGAEELSEQQRLTAATAFVTTLAAKGPLRANLDIDTATDIAWVHVSPDIYLSLVNRRGWSETAYRHWLTDTLTAALLPARRPPARPRPPRGRNLLGA